MASSRTFISEKYGPVCIFPLAYAENEVTFGYPETTVYVKVKDAGISGQVAELIIRKCIESNKYKRKRIGVKDATPDFSVKYPLFKMKLKEEATEHGSFDFRHEDGWWIVLYPPGTDFNNEIVQERLFVLFDHVLNTAASTYARERGTQIAEIIGTTIPKFDASKRLGVSVLGINHARPAKEGENVTSYDEDNDRRMVNEYITVSSSLLLYPSEYIDSVLIHELIHNFFFDHGQDFQDTTDYYCEKILRKTEDEISRKYSGWSTAPFAEKPLYKFKPRPYVPKHIIVNGRRLRRLSEDKPLEKIYFNFDNTD